MRSDSPQWHEVGQAATPAEDEALGVIKAMLPEAAIAWAWSNLSFISVHGRLAEVDLLLLTRAGLTLVELKGWHGRITGNQRTWRVGVEERANPLFLTDQKAKWLKELLAYVQPGPRRVPVPFIKAITVLHGRDSVVDLDPVATTATYGLDGFNVRGVPAFSEYLERLPNDARDVVDAKRAKELVAMIAAAGFTAPPRTRMVGQYAVERLDAVEQGPSWSDVIAQHPHLPGQRKRIRIYDVPRQSSAEQRQQVIRMAQREFFLTSGLRHPGVVAPEDFFDDPAAGPALVFAYDPGPVRLDRWLEQHADDLTLDRRLEVIRQLAEILRYAHARGVTHRALSAHRVFIEGEAEGTLRVSVRDWQTGREEPGLDRGTNAPSTTILQGTRHVVDHIDPTTWVYLAPELHAADEPDGVALDVYGLGSVGYLVITGKPPADSIPALERRIRGSAGLDPAVELDGIPDGIRALIQRATHPDARVDRTPDAEAFLADLDAAEHQLRDDTEPEPVIDPLQAQVNDVLDDRFLVIERLGSGSTGVALLVSDLDDESVLKVAHDATKEHRLAAEHAALASLDHPRVVKVLADPFLVGGRLTLQLQDAGRPTLGSRIRQEGRLTLDQLERYGADLLEAAAHLDARSVLHRDIKPDNLGVRPDPTDRRPRLVLFDFSLADEPLEHVKAGTPPYLDPFLGAGRRPRYDRAAERFAIAVTLFEMATGTRPVWGSGGADPATITDEVTLTPDLFEPSIAAGMIAFFRKALARDASQRHGDLAELAQGWSALFAAADASSQQVDEDGTGEEVEVSASTSLSEAGLSARAQSAVARLGVATVGELLSVSPFRINSIPGLGEKTRRELQRRIRAWRRAIHLDQGGNEAPGTNGDTAGEPSGQEPGQPRGIDAIAAAYVPKAAGRSQTEVQCARALIGIQAAGTESWPNLIAVAEVVGVTPARVSQVLDRLRKPWLRTSIDIGMDAQVQAILAGLGGVAEASEVARALLATCGSAAYEPDRTRQALGVVRAVVEADLTRGGDSAIASRRHGPRVILALEPADPDAPAADAVIDWVRRLAQAADRLAATQPIPVRATALAALRAIKAPAGVVLTDERLLRIAAAASTTAAVGGRGEIYPRGMAAAEAIRLTLAGLAASRLQLTPQALAERVRGRFPEAQRIPERPALDRIVQECDAGLAWNGTAYASTTATTGSLLSTEHGRTMLGARHAGPRFDEVDARLRAALASDSYLTLAVDPRRQQQATEVLASEYGLTVVNLTDLLLDAARELATSSGVDWAFLLAVDAKDPASPDRVQLNHFVATALDQAMPKVLASSEPLLLTEPAPLGRYRQQQWLATLADLTTPRPAARWLLVPHRDSAGAPTLDAQVPVPLGADGFLPISIDFLDRHAMQADAS
ncbi:MAG: BREX system serine/threonine kinase PglW [Actinomycetales bacterium]|nr:BREX system serine/threonine kinase PglW [Actinomycetales bacterium]